MDKTKKVYYKKVVKKGKKIFEFYLDGTKDNPVIAEGGAEIAIFEILSQVGIKCTRKKAGTKLK